MRGAASAPRPHGDHGCSLLSAGVRSRDNAYLTPFRTRRARITIRLTCPHASCLTILAPIKQGEVAAVRDVLRPIGDDINSTHMPPGGRPHVAFTRSRPIHFARFAILADPDRGPDHARLCCTPRCSTEPWRRTLPSWSPCRRISTRSGKSWRSAGRDGFVHFLRAHAHEPAAYYIAFRDETVSSIRLAIAARDARDHPVDQSSTDPGCSSVRQRRLHG